MGLLRSIAVHGLVPSGLVVGQLREFINELIATTAEVIGARFGEVGFEALEEVFRRLGEGVAGRLREQLSLEPSVAGAADAWRVLGSLLGAKMDVHWQSGRVAEFTHSHCPQYEAFVQHGRLYCDSTCIPFVGSVATGVAPPVRVRVSRHADSEGLCIKAIEEPGV